jgi:NAD(P)-dependent dehydrogenase (short-subunit alcohol dehydrogenase family)
MAEFTQDDLMFRPGLMKGERILITGGGTGLGKVMAEACLLLGADVYIWGRRGNVIEATAKELSDAHGGKCIGMACDIRVPEAIHDAMDQVWAGGALTGLVNNAAGNFISRTEDLSPRGFDAIANIVFRGSFFVTLDDLMFKPGLLKGHRILITGGGTGLGKEMAEGCLALGAQVYICGRRGGVLKEAADELIERHGNQGGAITPIACDIRVPEAIHDMMDEVWAGGVLTGLVNNAAGNFISRTEDLSPRGFDAIANIVFRGSFNVTLDAG